MNLHLYKICNIVLLAVMSILLFGLGKPAYCLPDSVSESISGLKHEFYVMPLAQWSVIASIPRNVARTKQILDYAKASPDNFNAVAENAQADLNQYFITYGPGSSNPIPSKIYYNSEEESLGYGLLADAYILLELAKMADNPVFTKKVLLALSGFRDADENRVEAVSIKAGLMTEECQAAIKNSGGIFTDNIESLASMSEAFLVKLYLSDNPKFKGNSSIVINDFWQWRKAKLLKSQTPCLFKDSQHQVMGYIKRLAETLPNN